MRMEINEYLANKDLYVENAIDDKLNKIVFIVESPHTDEIKNKIPLYGESGKSIGKILFKSDKSIGNLKKDGILQKIGIINVSNVPLQKIDDNEKLGISFDELEKIRKCKLDNEFLVDNLVKNLNQYKDSESLCCIAVCGEFAWNYYEKAIKTLDNTIKDKICKNEIDVLHLLHPSRHQWEFLEKYTSDFYRLKEIVLDCDIKIN